MPISRRVSFCAHFWNSRIVGRDRNARGVRQKETKCWTEGRTTSVAFLLSFYFLFFAIDELIKMAHKEVE